MDLEAGDRPALYRALDALRVTLTPLGKSAPLNRGDPGSGPVAEAAGMHRCPNLQAQLSAAASLGVLTGPRILLWVCAASTLVCFAAAVATVAATSARGAYELSRSLKEVQRVLQINGDQMRVAMLSPAMTTDRRLANETATPGVEARDAARSGLNATGSASWL